MKPLFSCVVPVKGARPYMDEAMESLRNQGMGDDLEIIVQDGDVEPDKGQSDALNKGFAKAHGEWFFWLNADDVLLPGALKRVSDVITAAQGRDSRTDLSWIVGNQMYIDEYGAVVKCVRANGWHDWLYHGAVPLVNGPSSFFRRELFLAGGPFDLSLNVCLDWDLWIRFMKVGARFKRINSYLWAMRRWPGSKTQRKKNDAEDAMHQAEVRRMLEKNDFTVTVWGNVLLRVWRVFNGNYLLGGADTLRRRCCGREGAMILVKHRAPYRDPVIQEIEKFGRVRSFALFDRDFRHDWAGFADDGKAILTNGPRLIPLLKIALNRRWSMVLWPAYHPWWLTLPIVISACLGRRYALTSDTKEENGGMLARCIKRYVFTHAEFTWVPGRVARRYLENRMGVPRERIVEGLFIVDHAKVVERLSTRKSVRSEKFLVVGNDTSWRRLDVVVEAFRRSRSAGQVLTVCGKGCSKYDGDGVVGMEGVPWTALPSLYAQADIYVHNGKEQYSTAVQVAAMCGMPIICSSEVGIVADFDDPEHSMVVVRDWNSIQSWEKAFATVAKMSSVELKLLGDRMRQASQRFDIKKTAKTIWERMTVL